VNRSTRTRSPRSIPSARSVSSSTRSGTIAPWKRLATRGPPKAAAGPSWSSWSGSSCSCQLGRGPSRAGRGVLRPLSGARSDPDARWRFVVRVPAAAAVGEATLQPGRIRARFPHLATLPAWRRLRGSRGSESLALPRPYGRRLDAIVRVLGTAGPVPDGTSSHELAAAGWACVPRRRRALDRPSRSSPCTPVSGSGGLRQAVPGRGP